MSGVSITDTYDALLTTTLSNWATTLADNISNSNAILYSLRKSECYQLVEDLGESAKFPTMYQLGTADVFSGYDALDTTPVEGMTIARFTYANMSKSVTISREEERKNAGSEVRILNLLKEKTDQAKAAIEDLFVKGLTQGNGPNSATAITTKYTSPTNGAQFIDPLPLLVKYSPSTTSVGGLDPATYSWWQNQYTASGATTYAGFLTELRNLYHDCSRGSGGSPNFFVCDQLVFELYESALAAYHRNPSYERTDIPFNNTAFKGSPVVWDETIPDVANGTVSSIPVSASGTLYMLNLRDLKMRVDKATNFVTTEFREPIHQAAKTAHILWMGAIGMANRRKHGVMGSIDTTITS